MSNMTSESEDRLVANSYIDSPSIEEVSSEGNEAGGGLLKKGPWTSAEDAILVDYVNKHGEGNWNAVQKHSGLSRCGKSCRLRWANHLRPDLKKGAFTPDEERHIIELHANMGNKWARMAAEANAVLARVIPPLARSTKKEAQLRCDVEVFEVEVRGLRWDLKKDKDLHADTRNKVT